MRRPLMGHPAKMRLSTSPDFGRSAAVSALTFLAADSGRLERFLSTTGLGPQNLRRAADDPGFYTSVLDYILADEPLLIAFAADADLAPDDVVRARQALGGPPPPGDP
jgi:hypothetical protein